MMSVEEQVRIATDFVNNIAGGGIDDKYYADDLTVWTSSTGLLSREEYLPRLGLAKRVWSTPVVMKIDSTTAQPGRVVLQARSRGVLFTGQDYENEYLVMVEFNDIGQLRHIREYFNVDRVRDIYKPAVAKWLDLQEKSQVTDQHVDP